MDNFHQLLQGFHNFKQKYFLKEREYFESLEKSQNPKTLVVACCDSRVDPAILLHCKPGELFVIRNVAALIPSSDQADSPSAVMAAIEYGVKHLSVEHIVVLGGSASLRRRWIDWTISQMMNRRKSEPAIVRKALFFCPWIICFRIPGSPLKSKKDR